MDAAELPLRTAYEDVMGTLARAAVAAGRPVPKLLAVSKTRSADEVAQLHALGQVAFGENYVQEAAVKAEALAGLPLEWHLIGHLQTNKAKDAARVFDWVQSVDRTKLVAALDHARPADRPPLNVLVQVNVDGEAGKSGCRPDDVEAIAESIAATRHLRLRGLMAIPEPSPDPAVRRAAFAAVAALFQRLRARHPEIDTISMGMSDDVELAIAEGATLVRIGTALFGARPPPRQAD
jgi:pyridoxal phosphate enzyme (YggS family)